MTLTNDDVTYLDGIERQLNSMLKSRARSGGATFVDTYTPSVGHDACQSAGTRWVEPLLPQTDAFPVHPNAAGEAASARAVTSAIRTS